MTFRQRRWAAMLAVAGATVMAALVLLVNPGAAGASQPSHRAPARPVATDAQSLPKASPAPLVTLDLSGLVGSLDTAILGDRGLLGRKGPLGDDGLLGADGVLGAKGLLGGGGLLGAPAASTSTAPRPRPTPTIASASPPVSPPARASASALATTPEVSRTVTASARNVASSAEVAPHAATRVPATSAEDRNRTMSVADRAPDGVAARFSLGVSWLQHTSLMLAAVLVGLAAGVALVVRAGSRRGRRQH